ncbi:MAG: hypothetical protein J6N76_03615 [Lachnospiraceae bacterium]|nr:hypothetical protein [Lachnospiraceae bacterium]
MAEENKAAVSEKKKGKLQIDRKYIPLGVLAGFVIYMIVAFAVSILVFNEPIIWVGAMVVLSCLLAALLNQIPIWVHGLFFIGMIVAGVIFSHIPFMIMVSFVYLFAVMLLYVWTRFRS